jgi:hypothetical protein
MKSVIKWFSGWIVSAGLFDRSGNWCDKYPMVKAREVTD